MAIPAGEALADALEIILTRDAQDGLGGLALLVWAEALRSPQQQRPGWAGSR